LDYHLFQKENPMTIKTKTKRVMEEARRRYESFAVRDKKTLEEAWLGLGMPSYYREATDAGYMVALGEETPRVLNWYLLTEKGVALYRELYPNSEKGEHAYRDGSLISDEGND
jgi:hypothetical protein